MYMYGNENEMLGRLNNDAYLVLDFTSDALHIIDLTGSELGTGTWSWNDAAHPKAPDLLGSYTLNSRTFRLSAWYHEKCNPDTGELESFYAANLELGRPERSTLPRHPKRAA